MNTNPTTTRRAGFTYLELEVSFVLFAIALSGVGPLVVMQSRQVRRVESRLDADETHHLSPSTSPWARKLGAGAVHSTGTPPVTELPVLLIDNGDAGYSEEKNGDNWHNASDPAAFQGTLRRNLPDTPIDGTPLDTAAWNFNDLPPGAYELFATFAPDAAAAGNAPYRIYSDGELLSTVRIDQRESPSGPNYQGVPWQSLGTVVLRDTDLRVELGDDADGNVLADAVRIEPTGGGLTIVSLNKSLDGQAVSVVVSVPSYAP
jgi:hypothetical protein